MVFWWSEMHFEHFRVVPKLVISTEGPLDPPCYRPNKKAQGPPRLKSSWDLIIVLLTSSIATEGCNFFRLFFFFFTCGGPSDVGAPVQAHRMHSPKCSTELSCFVLHGWSAQHVWPNSACAASFGTYRKIACAKVQWPEKIRYRGSLSWKINV